MRSANALESAILVDRVTDTRHQTHSHSRRAQQELAPAHVRAHVHAHTHERVKAPRAVGDDSSSVAMSSLSMPFLSALKSSPAAPSVGGATGSSFTAALRQRRKQKDIAKTAAAPPPLHPLAEASDVPPAPIDTDVRPTARSMQAPLGQHRSPAASSATLGVAVSAAGAAGGSVGYGSFVPLTTRLSRAASAATAGVIGSAATPAAPEARQPSISTTAGATAMLDTISDVRLRLMLVCGGVRSA